ncbi:HAD domain-containing protein [Paraburkholderia sp. HP33-1]|uniref:HAD domain-containing protein n=1 Tax=Paraburkholderia sp. HP33-1 TaxID=2883243 RepID=UPI001EEBC6FC|nr:HAD domain-containing protein [Paraburkholderia sp. HP33-1]
MLTGLPGESLYIPPPRRCGGLVLYLDLDGCLHPESVYLHPKFGPILWNAPGHELFEHVKLLEQVLEPYLDVCIILSTSWVPRYRGSLRRVLRRFTPSLRARVVGATYHSQMSMADFTNTAKGMQVWSDVLRRKPEAWIALDDDDKNWPAWCRDHLVRTDPYLGIGEASVLSELQAKLAEIFTPTTR